jgi:hypothetical protein
VTQQLQTPFDSVESAHDYVRLLSESIREAQQEIAEDINDPGKVKSDRHREALRLVQYKLDRLEQYLHSSSRVLNDLRSLRRLLLEERFELAQAGD